MWAFDTLKLSKCILVSFVHRLDGPLWPSKEKTNSDLRSQARLIPRVSLGIIVTKCLGDYLQIKI